LLLCFGRASQAQQSPCDSTSRHIKVYLLFLQNAPDLDKVNTALQPSGYDRIGWERSALSWVGGAGAQFSVGARPWIIGEEITFAFAAGKGQFTDEQGNVYALRSDLQNAAVSIFNAYRLLDTGAFTFYILAGYDIAFTNLAIHRRAAGTADGEGSRTVGELLDEIWSESFTAQRLSALINGGAGIEARLPLPASIAESSRLILGFRGGYRFPLVSHTSGNLVRYVDPPITRGFYFNITLGVQWSRLLCPYYEGR